MKVSRLLSLVMPFSMVFSTSAALFPDVQPSTMYQSSIEALVEAGVIGGNPDGNFYPNRSVNRAELLKMLYKAKGIVPGNAKGCFSDVAQGAWYESYVCDAVARKFVAGYSDGKFRPAVEVNRVEALKMIITVFGIELKTDIGRLSYGDLAAGAWYMPYISTAEAVGIIPITGQIGPSFYPNWPLLRGEAAAYIYAALHAPEAPPSESSSSSSSRRSVSSSSPSTAIEKDFPFTYEGTFTKKTPMVFLFDVTTTKVVNVEALLEKGGATITCRLYLLDDSGFSERYYLGFEDESSCFIRATLTPGSYQLQVQPSVPDADFIVKTETSAETDKSDGFSEASTLPPETARTGTLPANDIQDWYKFTVGKNEEVHTVELTGTVTCIIYVENDVDLFGFELPNCNTSFNYPQGTYYIGITRTKEKASSQTYTILLR